MEFKGYQLKYVLKNGYNLDRLKYQTRTFPVEKNSTSTAWQ